MASIVDTFKGVIFDLDGLLIDSETIALKAFNNASDAVQVNLPRSVFDRCVGTNFKTSKRILEEAIGSKETYAAFAKAWDDLYHAYLDQDIPLKPGAVELLDYLKTHQKPLAVATSSRKFGAQKKLTGAGIIQYFDTVVSGDEVHESKPNPEIYQLAAERLGLLATECVALEDSRNGVISAVGAGMTVIQIPDLIQPDPALLKLGPIVLNSLHQVIHYEFNDTL